MFHTQSTFKALIVIGVFAVATSTLFGGVLKQHTGNSKYFMDGSGDAIYMTGSHTWHVFQDYQSEEYDWDSWVADMYDWNHNFLRGWTFEDAYYSPMPYTTTGGKYNLTQYNSTYFNRIGDRIADANANGIFVSYMLFQGPSLDNFWTDGNPNGLRSPNPWPQHPYDGGNNNNSIDGDPNDDDDGSETHTLQISAVTAKQEDYVEHCIDTFNDIDHLVWEISNESRWYSLSWMNHMINHVKSYEAANYSSRTHLVWVNCRGDWDGTSGRPDSDDLFSSNADIISPNNHPTNYTSNIPVYSGNKIVILDNDHINAGNPREDFIWESFTRGYHAILMDFGYDGLTWWQGISVDPDEGTHPQELTRTRDAMGRTLSYAQRMDLANVTAQNGGTSPCNTGYCLYDTGDTYAIYQPTNGADVTVYLPSGTYYYEWVNITSNAIVGTGTVTSSGSNKTLSNPTGVDCSLYIEKFDDTSKITIDLGRYDVNMGMNLDPDPPSTGNTQPWTKGGRECRRNNVLNDDKYMFFNVDDDWAYQGSKPNVKITVEYYDQSTTDMNLKYDGTSGMTLAGQWSRTDSGTWKSVSYTVIDAYFGNGIGGDNDIRVSGIDSGERFFVDKITIEEVIDSVSVDLGTTDDEDGLARPATEPTNGETVDKDKGGRNCRRNKVPYETNYYFYFCVDDEWAFEGSKSNVYVSADVYVLDSSEYIALHYDNGDMAYKNAGKEYASQDDTWETLTWHLTDAYFGNGQAEGADFRLKRSPGYRLFVDVVEVSTSAP